MAAIIEVRDVVKRFDGVTAVDHVSFAVPEGVVFGFLGPNGAGKTTTIKMLTTVLTPSEGWLRVAGHDPVKEPMLVRRALGIVFQDRRRSAPGGPALRASTSAIWCCGLRPFGRKWDKALPLRGMC